jgi:hypothetical protein
MLGRQNKELIVRLFRYQPTTSKTYTTYYLFIAKKKSIGHSRIDSLGKLVYRKNYALLKLNLNKLNFYLTYMNLSFSEPAGHVIFLDFFEHTRYIKKNKGKFA